MEIREIRKEIEEAGFSINQYAKAYIDALEDARAMYGEHGVKVQVLYICSNLRARGDKQKKAKKRLLEYARSG